MHFDHRPRARASFTEPFYPRQFMTTNHREIGAFRHPG
jgi:hypothetical protein